jgi:hypothetical protein
MLPTHSDHDRGNNCLFLSVAMVMVKEENAMETEPTATSKSLPFVSPGIIFSVFFKLF